MLKMCLFGCVFLYIPCIRYVSVEVGDVERSPLLLVVIALVLLDLYYMYSENQLR